MQFSIYRYNPEIDTEPSMKNYDIDVKKHNLIMLLDVLLYIKNHVDETLTVRRSCREGVCGSDV